MSLSRREFVLRVGQAGGFGAAYVALQGLGLTAARAEAVRELAAPRNAGGGRRVVVLGAGIAGLVAAYELRALGFAVTVLEARERAGGRNWTVRGGDTVEFTDGTRQVCEFGTGLYQNVGPARLPSVHTTILGYCRKFGVPMEVEVNSSRSAMLENDAAVGGRAVTQRQAVNDTRGHVAELLAKCVAQGSLDADLAQPDRERMLEFLRFYGPLDRAGAYRGSDRAGYKKTPGAGDDEGVLAEPLDMHTLLDARFWNGMMFDEQFDMQATMFQPVGGMDAIPRAFARALGEIVRYGAPVTEIRKTATGVRVGYRQGGQTRQAEAEFCVCALPLNLLARIPNDFAPEYQAIFRASTYSGSFKFCWESRRFWEQEDNIYGGLEFCSPGLSPVWLPSAGFFSERGVLVSGYAWQADAAFEKLDWAGKCAASRRSVEKLHPGRGHELEKPLYVPWGRIPWNEGAWIESYGTRPQAPGAPAAQGGPGREQQAQTRTNANYEQLLQPDGPLFLAGDHCSHVVAWQEGAALSARRVVEMIAQRAAAGPRAVAGSAQG